MKPDGEVLEMLEKATNEIEEVLGRHGIKLVYAGDTDDGNHEIHAQYEQMHLSGDLSVRSMQVISPEF